MEEIIKVMLMEGIDEDTIHRVLDVIEEEYEVVSERNDRELYNRAVAKSVKQDQEWEKHPYYKTGDNKETRVAKFRLLDRAYRRAALAGRKQWKKLSGNAKGSNDLITASFTTRRKNADIANNGSLSNPKVRDILNKNSRTTGEISPVEAEKVVFDGGKGNPVIQHTLQAPDKKQKK